MYLRPNEGVLIQNYIPTWFKFYTRFTILGISNTYRATYRAFDEQALTPHLSKLIWKSQYLLPVSVNKRNIVTSEYNNNLAHNSQL